MLIAILTILGVSVEGIMPTYAEGVREGYITKFSKKGFLWKTWEGQIQVGTGEQAALQAPHDFSVSDAELAAEIRSRLGKRVVLHYRQWLVMPFSVGESGYDVVKIDIR
jgi:hypothetical protein